MSTTLNLVRGEAVRVLSREQILSTLDEKGELDGLPFMPEMLRSCGQTFRVDARADKTCDTISGELGARRMEHAVHLSDSRCDGTLHGGCEADCLIFWKEGWLERVEASKAHPLWRLNAATDTGAAQSPQIAGCTSDALEGNAVRTPTSGDEDPRYRCQTTQLLEATSRLSAWAPRPYLRDWLSGNVSLGFMLKIAVLRLSRKIVVFGRGFVLKVKLYDVLARFFGEPVWPYYGGRLSGPTPIERLDLAPGEWVTVKAHQEILETLNDRSNRGMAFTAEMVRYCGGTYRVRARVEKILDEGTGELIRMKNDCIILEDVVCRSECSTGRLFCPRAIYPYWREIWLRRANPQD